MTTQLQNAFNAQAVDPTQSGGLRQLPVGKHPVIITKAEIKATNAGDGGMMVFDLKCTGGPGDGQEGIMRLNVYSSSEKARQIAESQLSALCHATGVFMLQDLQQLYNIPFGVEVKEQILTPEQVEKKNKGENVTPFTQVTKILNNQGQEPAAAGQQAQAPAPSPASAPAPAASAPPASGWGQQAAAAAQAPAPSPAPAPNAGWGQQPATGAKPAWGQ